MLESTVRLTVAGSPLAPADLTRVQSVDVSESMGGQTRVSVVVSAEPGAMSQWTTPLDSLVQPFAPFEVTLARGSDTLAVPARATSASWHLDAGAASTLTIAGLDASADLDREEHDQDWGGVSDADIARRLLAPIGTPQVGTTPQPDGTDRFTPHQRATDWAYLRTLAARNDFDVYVESRDGRLVAVFDHIDPLAPPSVALDLGYGDLGGTSNVEAQLVAGQKVRFTHGVEGSGGQQVAGDDGTGHAMGTQSLGGAVTVLRDASDISGIQPPDVAARVMAEQSAFAATLSVSLTAPQMPLVRARRTVQVNGLGPLVSGPWLVKSVRHTVTPAGHTEALSLTRNALGDPSASGPGGLALSLSASIGVSL